MNSARLAAALATTALTLACSSPLDAPLGLLGHWTAVPESLSPQGRYWRHLNFSADGSYQVEVRTYGLYPDQAAGDLSAVSREEGRFRTDGDRLAMTAQRLVVWDRFYRAGSPEQVLEPFPYGDAPLDGARFEILGDRLVLRYTGIGPADGPVAVTAEYWAIR